MFPDDGACARYLESVLLFLDGFACPRCAGTAEPMRLGRPHLLRCRNCKRDISLTAGTVMDRTHTPLVTWFWAAYLISSLTPGMSAVQLQRQLGLSALRDRARDPRNTGDTRARSPKMERDPRRARTRRTHKQERAETAPAGRAIRRARRR